ncbi:MAG TPA: class I SAM-dependent methyltransferase [Chlamydiales bacterium]|nr:class I SAM-dependent methyltransferase [Chlamydiales bacterium]
MSASVNSVRPFSPVEGDSAALLREVERYVEEFGHKADYEVEQGDRSIYSIRVGDRDLILKYNYLTKLFMSRKARKLVPAKATLTVSRKQYLIDRVGASVIQEKIMKLGKALRGDQFEEEVESTDSKIDEAFWSTDWKGDKGPRDFYRNKCWPVIEYFVGQVMKPGLRMLELCGGDGELAERILQKYSDKISRLDILELNREVSKEATKRLTAYKNSTVHEQDIAKADYKSLTSEVDVVYGSGALTQRVLSSKNEAIMALMKAEEILKPGGILILSGLAPSWVNSKDLIGAGFEVRNTYSPVHEIQCYVAIKSV